MLVLFFLPWAATIASPVAGFVATSAVVVYHWLFHRDIVQRIEMSVLVNPRKILTNHQERYAAPQIRQATGGEQTQSREGEEKVEGDGPQETGGRKKRAASKTEVKTVKSHYVWDYSEW